MSNEIFPKMDKTLVVVICSLLVRLAEVVMFAYYKRKKNGGRNDISNLPDWS